MWLAAAFHQGARPLEADRHARCGSSPGCIKRLRRVRGRFHWRQRTQRNLRRIQPSSSSNTPLASASRKYCSQPRRMGVKVLTVDARVRPRPWRSVVLSLLRNRFTTHLSVIVCICWHHRQTGLLRYSTFGPSPAWCCRRLQPRLTSVVPSRRLATPVAHPLPGAARQTSQGKTHDLRAIYLSHLRPHLPGDIGLWAFGLPRPGADASYALAVRQTGTLLTASFRPRLATTPLLLG